MCLLHTRANHISFTTLFLSLHAPHPVAPVNLGSFIHLFLLASAFFSQMLDFSFDFSCSRCKESKDADRHQCEGEIPIEIETAKQCETTKLLHGSGQTRFHVLIIINARRFEKFLNCLSVLSWKAEFFRDRNGVFSVPRSKKKFLNKRNILCFVVLPQTLL